MENYKHGFGNLQDEVSRDKLATISGSIPIWINGNYVKNGPAKFSLGDEKYEHWFDGLAMVHGFRFENGSVHYSNRYLKSSAYTEGIRNNKICYSTFATYPQWSLLMRFINWFREPKPGYNANVNIMKVGNSLFGLTESVGMVKFDMHSLETLEEFEFDDEFLGSVTTAHPHYDAARDEYINMDIQFSRVSHYCYTALNAKTGIRRLIGKIPIALPSYTHSFSVTDKYIVHVDYPLRVNPLRLRFGNIPYIKCFKWHDDLGTQFTLLDKQSGEVKARYETESLFAFHHVNAYESNDGVVVDIATKPDCSLIKDLYMENLLTSTGRPIRDHSTLQRFILPIKAKSIRTEILTDEYIELPTINTAGGYDGYKYRYTYGVGLNRSYPDQFENQIVKIDTHNTQSCNWFENGCYPGEPLFVPDSHNPSGIEDRGVLLSVVFDSRAQQSFLLILDGGSLGELARVSIPHVVPFGFHGQFYL